MSYYHVNNNVDYVLGWPKISFRFFHNILQKNPNELFGQPYKCNFFPCDISGGLCEKAEEGKKGRNMNGMVERAREERKKKERERKQVCWSPG